MKKLFTAALGTLMVFGLVACGGSKDPTPDPTPSDTPSVNPSVLDHVFACEEGSALHYQGGAFGWDLADENKMEAASINDVAAIDEHVASILADQIDNIKYLYIAEGLTFGAEDAGWTTNVKREGGEVVSVNGSHTIKARRGHYDAEDEAYVSDQWIPDPHTSHAMSLTPDTLFIAENWAEEADEDGFDWTANPAAFDAGVYTFIAAEFKATASPETYSAGLALVPVANA